MNAIAQLIQSLQMTVTAAPESETAQPSSGLAGLFGALLDHARSMLSDSGEPSAEDLQLALEEAAELAAGFPPSPLVSPAHVDGAVLDHARNILAKSGEPSAEDLQLALEEAAELAAGFPMGPLVSPAHVGGELIDDVSPANQPASPETKSLTTALETLQAILDQGTAKAKKTDVKPIPDSVPVTVGDDAITDDPESEALSPRRMFVRAMVQQESSQNGNPGVPVSPLSEQAETQAFTVKPPPHLPEIVANTLPPPALQRTDSAVLLGEKAVEQLPPQVVDVREVGSFTVKAIRYLAGRGEETVTIRLVPRSLGELHITLRTSGDDLEVILTAANHAARDTLELRLPELREAFTRDGLDVVKVTVQTFTRDHPGEGRFGSETSNSRSHADRPGSQGGGEHGETEAESRASPRTGVGHDGFLNTLV